MTIHRDAFTHDPLLGRAIDRGQELLPPENRLPKEQNKYPLWREIATIPVSEMVNGLKLEEDLWQRLSAFLQRLWQSLTKAFLQARECNAFIADLGLADLFPIRSAPLTTLTMGASGTSETFSSGPSYFLPISSDRRP
jgi:hypothetical protein